MLFSLLERTFSVNRMAAKLGRDRVRGRAISGMCVIPVLALSGPL